MDSFHSSRSRRSRAEHKSNCRDASSIRSETHWLIYAQVPGSVPFLDQFDFPAYAGNVMVPFEGQFSLLG